MKQKHLPPHMYTNTINPKLYPGVNFKNPIFLNFNNYMTDMLLNNGTSIPIIENGPKAKISSVTQLGDWIQSALLVLHSARLFNTSEV